MIDFLVTDWWLRFSRSRYWKKEKLASSFTVVSLVMNGFLFLLLGFESDKVTAFAFHGADPVRLIDHYFIIALIILQSIRFFLGRNYAANITPYLRLPIPKRLLVFGALAKKNFNPQAVLLLLFLVPFWVTNIVPRFDWPNAVMWIVGAVLIMFLLESVFWMLKLLFFAFPVGTSFITSAAIAGFIVLDRIHLLSLGDLSILDKLLVGNIQAVVFLSVFVALCVYVICAVVAGNLHVDASGKSHSKFTGGLQTGFLEIRYPLVYLQAKSLIRNRLMRGFLLEGVLALAVVVFESTQNRFQYVFSHMPFMAVLVVVMGLGYFYILPYGYNLFGWDGLDLAVFLTKNIRIHDYMRSKLLYMNIVWGIFAVVCLAFYNQVGYHFSLLAVAMALYSMGILSYLLLLQSLLGFRPIYPNIGLLQNMSNAGITKHRHFALLFLLYPIMVMYVLYIFPLSYQTRFYISTGAIAATGLVGWVFRRRLQILLVNLFVKKKYHLFEGL